MDQITGALTYLGAFISVLGLVVFVHEFGHYQVGRWCGIAVKSFSIGFGKEWFGWTDKHGTRWKVSQIPIGGFVSWVDDTDPTSAGAATQEHQAMAKEEARKRGHFRAMPIWRRAVTVAAGPGANFVFSILVFAAILMTIGRDVTDNNALPARIDAVAAHSAAAEAGLRPGDLVVAADGQDIASFGALQALVTRSAGQTLRLTVRRDGADIIIPVTPRSEQVMGRDGVMTSVGRMGVGRNTLPSERRIERLGPVDAVIGGAQVTWSYVAATGAYVGAIISGHASGDQIAGPAGIFAMSGQVATQAIEGENRSLLDRAGSLALSLVGLAAVLSVAVGIANLLPVPLLDGGQLMFYAIEALRGGRQLPVRVQEMAFWAGTFVLGGLFLFATWNDFQRHWQDLRNFFS